MNQLGIEAEEEVELSPEELADLAETLLAKLELARDLAAPRKGRVIAVFGSAGLRDKEKRGMMGHVAGRLADLTVVTAEDPRTERVEDISAEIAQGLEAEGRTEGIDFWQVPDRREAIAAARWSRFPGRRPVR